MKSPKRTILGLIGITIGGLCLLTCLAVVGLGVFGPKIHASMLAGSSLQVNEVAPDFELSTLTGETVRLSQFRGQPVLLTIGAAWCPDCQREAPLLQQIHEDHP